LSFELGDDDNDHDDTIIKLAEIQADTAKYQADTAKYQADKEVEIAKYKADKDHVAKMAKIQADKDASNNKVIVFSIII